MSIEAMSWAMKQQIVTNPTARHVLLCLANFANDGGDAAFPAVNTLIKMTGLSRRSIYNKLDELEKLGVIKPGNQKIVAAYIDKKDKRPACYDICIWLPLHPDERGAGGAPRNEPGCRRCTTGVQEVHDRGAGGAPNPSFNPSLDPVINTQTEIVADDEPEPEPEPEPGPNSETIRQASKRFHDSPINRQGGKKSDEAFAAAWKRSGMDLTEFTDMLIDDVHKRISAGQFGFEKLHSTTYLRNDRWTDEIRQGNSEQHAQRQRLDPLEQFEQAKRERDAGQYQGGLDMAEDDRDIRGHLDQRAGQGAVRALDSGSFDPWET